MAAGLLTVGCAGIACEGTAGCAANEGATFTGFMMVCSFIDIGEVEILVGTWGLVKLEVRVVKDAVESAAAAAEAELLSAKPAATALCIAAAAAPNVAAGASIVVEDVVVLAN